MLFLKKKYSVCYNVLKDKEDENHYRGENFFLHNWDGDRVKYLIFEDTLAIEVEILSLHLKCNATQEATKWCP